MTIRLTVAAGIGAFVDRHRGRGHAGVADRVLRAAGTAYVTLVRNTPLTLIVFFCVGLLRLALGIRLGPQDSRSMCRLSAGAFWSWRSLSAFWLRHCAAA